MCLASLASFCGVVAGLLGLSCVAAMQGTKGKVWTGIAGGISMIVAGRSYANNIFIDKKANEKLSLHI